MTSGTEKLIETLDTYILRGLEDRQWTASGIRDLAEARAWLTNPDQSHGGHTTG